MFVKVKRGLYALPTASLEVIGNRINPDAYISTGTVLAQNLIVGSVPARRVQAVKIGRPRLYTCELGVVEHLSIDPRLHFGFTIRDGIKYATPEKAFLDVCYFSFKGKTFSFDLDSDVDREPLDAVLLSRYLERYDTRFVTCFQRTWGT